MSTSPVSLNIHHNIPSTSNKALHWCSPCYTQQHPPDTCRTGNSGTAGVSDLYNIADAIDSMIIDDTEDLKANLVMELARARREKLLAEKSLADCVVRELELMASLSKFKSSLFEQKLNRADVGLGYMRIAFKTHGLSHRAHHLYSKPGNTLRSTVLY
ncbi:uncharacterized protein EDB91DRAFT_1098551 [Suillus paluster]|uniref:uncharacterized protein n=1 Tax=Suillus paluster TaxID=48578 RepID=UPI001B878EBC|nr:uncharacterized protein EDB91DRAFT_1098551 [Suillus paluster]KAG1753540.1 hypothetical protein EDB91DRAFT_1098551 [Suillus paluster]